MFGKLRENQSSLRGEEEVGFLVRECLVDEVEFVSNVRYEESVWMKVRGGREVGGGGKRYIFADIGASDHFLVWLELGRVTKCFKKQKWEWGIRKWRLDRLADEGVRGKYKEALKAEVEAFSESIREKVSEGTRGSGLVSAAIGKWEQVVKKVASAEVGEKVIVCGRAVRWWDNESRKEERFTGRLGVLWGEYTKLCKEVKSLVIELLFGRKTKCGL